MESQSDIRQYISENLALVSAAAATAGVVAFYMLRSSAPAVLSKVPLDNQSVELEPGCRTSHYAADGKLVSYYYEDAKTCYEAFLRGLRVSGNGPCLGTRTGPNLEYEWLSYKQVLDKGEMLGSAFVEKGLKLGEENIVGIYANNCPEWVITEQACNMFSMASVPLYDTLGEDACSYIMNQTSMEIVVCDNAKKVKSILTCNDTPALRIIVLIEPVTPEIKAMAEKTKIQVLSFQEMLDIGDNNMHEVRPPKPEDLMSICYTSGTTGNPKGVMLSHQNLISNTASVLHQVPAQWFPTDTHLSYLPLAHMFERLTQAMMYQHGARVGFFRGDIKLLTDDLQALRPTIFPTVPRLMNRIYDKVMMGVQSSAVKKFLFNMAISRKSAMVKQGIHTKDTIWDRLVFSKIQNLLGGRVRICVLGSAPLSGNILEFARCAFGCTVIEGYGQTETTAGISATMVNEYEVGMVGPPLNCNIVKLVDVPEMDYFVKNNKGEVCVKGFNVMMGYYKDPEKTRETIDKDGWVHTGDVGQWLENGSLKIIDRKKHIFKLAQGEYLAPEKIEGIYVRSSLVAQAFVDGNSLHTYPVAVFVPDPETLPVWAENQGIKGSMKELCENESVKKAIYTDVIKHGKEAGLKGFEQIKQLSLFPELFSVENGFLTPTFKAKRPVLRKHFSDIISEMYVQPPL